MGKAEIKEVLYRYNAQNCFSREGEDGESVVAWISDTSIDVMGMRFLSSARKDDPNALVTIDEAVHNLFIESLHAIQEPHCKLYVHCLDKPRYVVSAKQPEQKRRDDAKRKAEAKKPSLPMSYRMHSLTREEAGIAVGKDGFSASVYDWKKSVHERATKKHVIAQLCLRAKTLLPQWMAAASIPEDRYIVIDFDDIHTSHSVIVASSRGDLSSDKQVASQFENKLGEFDVAHLHHLDTPCLRQAIASGKNDGVEPRVIVKSTDADIVLVDALHAASTTWELPKETRILSTLPSKLSDTNKRCTIVVNPWGVAAWVNEVVGAGLSKDPIGDFTKIYVMSGTDFVDGVPGCGNFTFMDKYLKWLVSTKYTSNQPAQADDTESCSPSLFLAKVIKDTIEHTENKGIKNASLVMSKRRQMCLDADYTQRSLRSLWVLDYWRWSYPDQGRVPSHLGMGWATKAGEHVYTEDILKGVPSNSTQKRIKLC